MNKIHESVGHGPDVEGDEVQHFLNPPDVDGEDEGREIFAVSVDTRPCSRLGQTEGEVVVSIRLPLGTVLELLTPTGAIDSLGNPVMQISHFRVEEKELFTVLTRDCFPPNEKVRLLDG